MKQRVISLMLTVAMGATLLAGCGSSATDSANAGADSGKESAAAAGTESDEKDFSGEGKVINIYSWNDEFRTRLEAVYPEVESTSSDGTVTTLKDGTEIHWVINPNQDGVYQQKLDEALMNQADAAADDKVDIFLSETDYVFKYTDKDADVAMPLTDLGIDPETDLADQYDFTRTTASDSDGVQRGSTWQCCPGLLVYRRDIAKDVFGTDDPEAVGEKVKDWATIKDTAAELKTKGYYTFASYADTFRLYGNSIDESWVQPGDTTVKVDQKIINWVNDSKEWLDAGYLDDEKYARRRVRHLSEDKKCSAYHARQECQKRGIDREIIDRALAEQAPDNVQTAKDLILRKYSRKLQQEDGRQKVMAALARRGFCYHDIQAALEQLEDEEYL